MKTALYDDESYLRSVVDKLVNRKMKETDKLEDLIPGGNDDKYRGRQDAVRHDIIDHGISTYDYDTCK